MSRSPITAGNGGLPARRAIVRWTWRLMRRHRRQYAVITALVAIAVAATVFGTAVAYNLAAADGAAEFGDANTVVYYERDQSSLSSDEWLALGAELFGTIEPIGHRTVPVPGSVASVDYRAQAVDGPFSEPTLAIVRGRAPAGGTEAGLTAGIADLLQVDVGGIVDLDGAARTVVGIVENPSDLDDEFVLLEPSQLDGADEIAMLVSTDDDLLREFGMEVGGLKVSERGDAPDNVMAGVLSLLAGTVVLALVALVAAATFAVIAQRRLAQLGMLSAIGATERHLRLAMLATGVIAGVIGALGGALAGTCAWLALSALMESLVAHRIDPANLPWWTVAAGILLAMTATTLAAWWPARAMSRVPTVVALSGRTPRPASGTRSALIAPGLAAAGALAIYLGSDLGYGAPDLTETVLLIGGTLALLAGVLLLSPLLVRGVGRLARWLPIGPRLALRDLSRYQARSSAALAAIGLALGVPAVIVAATTAEQNGTPLGNVASNQLMISPDGFEGPFVPSAQQIDDIAAGVAELAETLGARSTVAVRSIFDPATPLDPRNGQRLALSVDRRMSDGWTFVGTVHAATPELLALMGLDPSLTNGGEIVTVAGGELFLGPVVVGLGEPPTPGTSTPARPARERIPNTATMPMSYESMPQALLDPEAALARGWTVEDAGRWALEFDAPLAADELAAAHAIAARHGMVVESRDDNATLGRVRLVAGGLGMLLALAVLVATVGLIRSESSDDLRTLTAAGATTWVRRAVSAACAGSLALLGAVLGVTSAYVGLAAGRVDHLTPLPWRDLALLIVVTPAVATAGAWLFAGRQPQSIAARPLQ